MPNIRTTYSPTPRPMASHVGGTRHAPTTPATWVRMKGKPRSRRRSADDGVGSWSDGARAGCPVGRAEVAAVGQPHLEELAPPEGAVDRVAERHLLAEDGLPLLERQVAERLPRPAIVLERVV